MKKILFVFCLLLTQFVAPHVRADDNATLKGIKIYNPPEDLDQAKQMAAQEQLDRITIIQSSVDCIQKAQNTDEIYACERGAHANLQKIRLIYCQTIVAPSPPQATDQSSRAKTKHVMSECDKAMTHVIGEPVHDKNRNPAPNDDDQ